MSEATRCDPQSAVAVLEPAARAIGADSRVRQNLALAYAFAGNWTQARTIAAQDVPADQLDGRIQQWMALATPAPAVADVTPPAEVMALPAQLQTRFRDEVLSGRSSQQARLERTV